MPTRSMRIFPGQVGRSLVRHGHRRALVAILTLMSAAASAPALAAPVDCSNPANLCTGDPCVIPAVAVLSPCVVDFGSVDLVIQGKIQVPNDGVLSFTAGSITANDAISGRHLSFSEGDGADVTLIANGDLVARKIDVSGRSTVGSITLQAGGNIELNRLLRAAARGP